MEGGKIGPQIFWQVYAYVYSEFLPRDANAERGIATASRLFVCPSVTLRYHDRDRLEFFEYNFTVS